MTYFEQIVSDIKRERAKSAPEKTQQRSLAFVVGLLALLLPVVLYLGPIAFYGCKRYSISHFYYSPFWGSFFIAVLAFIGTYMLTYTSTRKDEMVVAKGGGICAFLVAFLPASGHGCLNPEGGDFRARAFSEFDVLAGGKTLLTTDPASADYFKLTRDGQPVELLGMPLTGILPHLHYFSAGVLFLGLVYFCFFIFTRRAAYHEKEDNKGQHDDPRTGIKKIRDAIYRLCGSLIVISIVVLGMNFAFGDPSVTSEWNQNRRTFFWEAVALCAFGLSWLLKGRFYEPPLEWLGYLPRRPK
ncbi:MAG: hypothetical protein AAF744_10235 [Pseudomonadota bacterium]